MTDREEQKGEWPGFVAMTELASAPAKQELGEGVVERIRRDISQAERVESISLTVTVADAKAILSALPPTPEGAVRTGGVEVPPGYEVQYSTVAGLWVCSLPGGGLPIEADTLSEVESLARRHYASRQSQPADAGHGAAPAENAIGAAEREVGQFVYRRIERLMDAKAGTPEGAELSYLAQIVSDVEEYGATGAEDCAPSTPAPVMASVEERALDDQFVWRVPRHATEAMMEAGLYHSSADTEWSDLFTAFTAMVDAAVRDDGATDPMRAADALAAVPAPGGAEVALGRFCRACQAIPADGYCKFAGCPNTPAALAEMGRKRLEGYEFAAEGAEVLALSDGGGNSIATAQDDEIAEFIAVILNALPTNADAGQATPERVEVVAMLQKARGYMEDMEHGIDGEPRTGVMKDIVDLDKLIARLTPSASDQPGDADSHGEEV